MGILVGLLNALSHAGSGTFLKKLTGISPHFLTWVRMSSAILILAFFVTLFSLWEVPSWEYWRIVFFVTVPLEIALLYLGAKALQLSPQSLIGPLGAFTLVFLIPTGYFILGELPTLVGGIGVVLILIGSFFLGWDSRHHILDGLKNIMHDRGVQLALLGDFVASITISVAKFTFHYAPPLLSAFYITATLFVVLLPFLFMQSFGVLRSREKSFAGLWLLSGVSMSLHYIGISLMPVAYYISVKRLSMVFDVFFGHFIFREDRFHQRLAGSFFMVVGAILIAVG